MGGHSSADGHRRPARPPGSKLHDYLQCNQDACWQCLQEHTSQVSTSGAETPLRAPKEAIMSGFRAHIQLIARALSRKAHSLQSAGGSSGNVINLKRKLANRKPYRGLGFRYFLAPEVCMAMHSPYLEPALPPI